MSRIAIFGSITEDLFVDPNGMDIMTTSSESSQKSAFVLPYGAKLTAKHVETHYGGGAANVSVALAKLGHQTYVFGTVGDDAIGKRIIQNFSDHSVNISGIVKKEGMQSGFALIITGFDGERTVIFHPAATLFFHDFSIEILQKSMPEHIHLCHLSAEKNASIRVKIQKYLDEHAGISLSWNPGKTDIIMGVDAHDALFQKCSFLFLNAEEAEQFSGKQRKSAYASHQDEARATTPVSSMADFSEIADVFLQKGVQNIVITDGRKGATVYTKNHSFFVPPVDSLRVSTLGAGDAFASGFLAGWFERKDLHFAAQCATMLAASVIGKRGAQEGLMQKNELFA